MEKVNGILKNHDFCTYLSRIDDMERTRKFCRHGICHLMDVARIAYIMVLEKNIKVEKQIIYAAALLHDIGRGEQYEKGIPHETAGVEIAENILEECGFDEYEKKQVLNLIGNHRKSHNGNLLQRIFYKSDKISRKCFMCSAFSHCSWPDEKKNYGIEY
ncbi:HD domain-containing protein [Clostridium sp. JNZ X4-2]